jgi:hypothetical protein
MIDAIKDTTTEEEPDDFMKPKGKPSFSMPAFIAQIQREVMLGKDIMIDVKPSKIEEANA